MRRLLRLFAQLAALHHRGRRRARADPGKIRQRQAVGNALRRRALFGAVGPDRGQDIMRDLRGAAGSVPQLHARGSRMRDGATEIRAACAVIAGSGAISLSLRKALANEAIQSCCSGLLRFARNDGSYAVAASTSSKSSSKGAKVDSGLVDNVIGLRLP